jgi:hypothetical protein
MTEQRILLQKSVSQQRSVSVSQRARLRTGEQGRWPVALSCPFRGSKLPGIKVQASLHTPKAALTTGREPLFNLNHPARVIGHDRRFG